MDLTHYEELKALAWGLVQKGESAGSVWGIQANFMFVEIASSLTSQKRSEETGHHWLSKSLDPIYEVAE